MNARWILQLALALTACTADPPTARTVTVKATDYGDAWPLVAQQAQLGCDPPSTAYIEVNGKRYALNGNALRAGLPRPDEIRREPTKIFMADFTEKSMQLCLDQRR